MRRQRIVSSMKRCQAYAKDFEREMFYIHRNAKAYFRVKTWFRWKKIMAKEVWIKVKDEETDLSDFTPFLMLVPEETETFRYLNEISKKSLQRWIQKVNETTMELIMMRLLTTPVQPPKKKSRLNCFSKFRK